jgi:hypothetical protein
MSNTNDHKRDTTKGGLMDGITGITNTAKESVKQAEDASQTPIDYVNDLAAAARQTAEDAKKQQHDATASAIAQAQARDKERQHERQQADQSHSTSTNPAQQAANIASEAAAAAEKEKLKKEAEHAARWARIEAESAARAAEARRAEQAEQFQGSGGVGSQEQLDAIRQGYAGSGTADPSGSTIDTNQRASAQDNTNKDSNQS